MKFLYFLVTGSQAYKDKLDAFQTFFDKEGGFTAAFIWAIAVAAFFCLLYYFICRNSYSWAKVTTWICTMLVAGCVSYGVTAWSTGMYSKSGRSASGIMHTIQAQYDKKVKMMSMDQNVLDSTKAKLTQDIQRKGMFRSKPINMLCLSNLFYTMLFFYIFSICINGFSIHGAYIPHAGFYKP